MLSKTRKDYFRSAVFGIEDALVSTTGMVVGISAGNADKQIILLASLVTVSVEAVSMATTQFLSEEAVEELDQVKKKNVLKSLTASAIILISYFFAGLIPIIPVVLLATPHSIFGSIGFAIVGLFLFGYIKGKFVKVNPLSSAIRVMIIGGIASVIGVLVGYLFKI
ncbi:MAG: VIT1/CCC1 transporter family protein [Candidatus Daviesbacteria bacterium]